MPEKLAPKVEELERRVAALDEENRRLRKQDGYSGETTAKLVTFVGGPLDLMRQPLPPGLGGNRYRVPVLDPPPVLADLHPTATMTIRVGVYRIIDVATANHWGRTFVGVWEGIE